MVLGGKVELHVYIGGGQLEVSWIRMGYFGNWGRSMYIEFRGAPAYTGIIDLFVPNYSPVLPLPGVTIEGEFMIGLKMRRDSKYYIDLMSKGTGELAFNYYDVKLGIPPNMHIRYGVYISLRDIELDNAYTEFFTFELAPISLLL
ncbi:MAG: hypothetical protein L7H00_04260 [Vulcanisaeta sp.]|nr:hypothetical protein [Vulcanisaeta sp.]